MKGRCSPAFGPDGFVWKLLLAEEGMNYGLYLVPIYQKGEARHRINVNFKLELIYNGSLVLYSASFMRFDFKDDTHGYGVSNCIGLADLSTMISDKGSLRIKCTIDQTLEYRPKARKVPFFLSNGQGVVDDRALHSNAEDQKLDWFQELVGSTK